MPFLRPRPGGRERVEFPDLLHGERTIVNGGLRVFISGT